MLPTKEAWLQALSARHGANIQANFTNATIAICGLGGLGSNIAILLARAGIGKLILIDFDRVDLSNLHRQQYKASQIGYYKTDALKANLLELAPYTKIITHTEKITEENVKNLLTDADIICEAFDSAEAKAMLTNCVLEYFPEKYLLAASGMAGLASANSIKTRQITKHFYLCGDGTSDITSGLGLLATRVALCAAHQAHMVLKILAKQFNV